MRERRRSLIIVIAMVLFVVACTDSTDTTTPTTSSPTTTSTPGATTTADDPLYQEVLPEDPDVIRGELDNGLTYFIRENDSPGGRAQLRLLVDAGSVQEDPDQAGMAHFLEHMMFNGTERFPRNELIDVLESFGPRFGPDINASTSYDETIYELGLSTDDAELVQLSIDVLREWATRATLTETDVVEERGVILDEWRLRAQGFGARINEQLEQLILPGSVYEGHQPIGTRESIESTSPAELRRFYDDWYHPERMAVVAVGDFDAREMEEMITGAFSDIPRREDPRAWGHQDFEPPSEARARSYVDEEAALAGVTVLWPVRSERLMTVGDYRDSLATSFALEILGDRLSDDASTGEGALLGATTLHFDWTRSVGVRGVDVEIRAGLADEGLEAVLTEIERIRRNGITDDEYERVVNAYASLSNQLYEQRESIQDIQLAVQIADHHLSGDHLMSAEQRFEIETTILEELTTDDVEMALAELFSVSPGVLALGPDDAGLDIPSETRILEVLDGLATAQLEDRDGVGAGATELMIAPDPAPILAESVDARFDYTTLEFENGATVYLWPSDIASGAVYALVEGFGGTSLVDIEDLPEAYLMTEIIGRSGVDDLALPELRRVLADRIVGVQPFVYETRQGVEGNAASEDVESLFQLIHLTMAEPRFDPTALDAILDELETVNASRDDLPQLLFDEAVDEAYYGDDPRYFVLPSPDQLADFDLGVAERVYRDLFSNAGRFAFAFVGDFDTEEMAVLAARYIGSLPGRGEPTGFVDHQPLPPREVQVITVAAGADEQGQLGMFFTNPFEPTIQDRVTARLLELIVSARLRDRIREELAATYSISAGIDLQRDPDPYAESFILSGGDPTGLDQISGEVEADLADLQENGPTQEQFDTAVAQLRDELELVDNPTLADRLITAHLYPDQPVVQLAQRLPLLNSLTPDDVTELARIVFDLDQRIEVRQVPRP